MLILPLPPISPSPSFAYLLIAMFTQAIEGSAVHVVLVAEARFFSGARLHGLSWAEGNNLTKHLVSSSQENNKAVFSFSGHFWLGR